MSLLTLGQASTVLNAILDTLPVQVYPPVVIVVYTVQCRSQAARVIKRWFIKLYICKFCFLQ